MDKSKNKKRNLIATSVILLLILILGGAVTFAWLSYGRSIAVIGEISNPTAIHLGAGNQEDIKYMDLSGLDVTNGSYKDFVFCVMGDNVSSYKLQLAFTTNNQFEYEIYHAVHLGTESTPLSEVPANAVATADFRTHPDNTIQHYYSPTGTTKLEGSFKNKKSDYLAYTVGDTPAGGQVNLHDDTYQTGENSSYDLVNIYAEPLYWQTNSSILPETTDHFCDYYILRVKWDPDTAKNNKETDIIYISAKNLT